MRTYKVLIIETLEKRIDVNALNEVMALNKVKQDYENENIILDGSDHIDTDFEIVEEFEKERTIYIPENSYKIIEGNYSLNEYVKLMREFKENSNIIQFLADMLEK